MKKIFLYKWIKYGLLLVFGIFLGWIFFHGSGNKISHDDHRHEVAQGTVWTCAMHPQIKVQQPGKCPICGMDLIPLAQTATSQQTDPDAIRLTKEAAELARVLTTKVSRQNPVREVRLYGKVQADERRFQSQVSQVPGRIEKMFVNFTGEQVRKGQKLAEIYSPELVTAQQELIETAKTRLSQPELYEASKEKLRLWKLTDNQIESIVNSGSIFHNFEILSNTSGTVTARKVSTGDYVSRGTVLFDIADLSAVWVLFDAYETDLPFISQGERIKFSIQAIPATEFSGNIVFIDPLIDPVTRVAKVRVEAPNAGGKLKPEMFATGIVRSNLKEYRNNIVVPKSAVLWTGKRSIVYVRDQGTDEPVFRLREIGLGPVLGDSYVVTDGLTEGEEVVTNGTFSIDAAAQLEGKPSMMNTGGNEPAALMSGMIHDDSKSGNSHEMADTNMPENKTAELDKTNVSIDFILQLNRVFDKYVNLKNSLVHDDSKKALLDSRNLQEILSMVDTKLLTGDDQMKWTEISGNITKSLSEFGASNELNQQRKAFQTISNSLYSAVKNFGLTGKTVYYQFCPMYDNNKGGYWLSETKEILNPYFGKEMISCGETRESLRY